MVRQYHETQTTFDPEFSGPIRIAPCLISPSVGDTIIPRGHTTAGRGIFTSHALSEGPTGDSLLATSRTCPQQEGSY